MYDEKDAEIGRVVSRDEIDDAKSMDADAMKLAGTFSSKHMEVTRSREL